MLSSEKNTAFATLDIGTSQIKMGVYYPIISDKIILIDNVQNELIYGNAGSVRADYKLVREICFRLFKELGAFSKRNNIEALYIGICGHVSSLLEWNKINDTPPTEPFPIWLDTTCYNSVEEYKAVLGTGKSKQIIGTFLPAGTNWLFTKLLYRKSSGFNNGALFLQVSDAIFHELTSHYKTHFYSQISMVNLRQKKYAQELLDHLGLAKSYFPVIDEDPSPVVPSQKKLFDFPDKSFVFPGMADLYASLYGLKLENKEGFMLANTSEQAGAFYQSEPKLLDNFLNISFKNGFINYGSTNTGGNVLGWFVTSVLNKKMTSELLEELTTKAAAIDPSATPIILPYLQGERAPLWNSQLTASILELKAFHTKAHLFRAILESIAFARRHCFEELSINDLELIKMGGGSSKNNLWNTIRATVLNKPVAVADEKELAMAGMINYVIDAVDSSIAKPAINFTLTNPQHEWINVYNEKYSRFIKYQKLLS